MNVPLENECDDARLAVLLVGDQHSDDFQHSAEHVQGCAYCQNRLTQLAADGEAWQEVSELLAASDAPFDRAQTQLAALLSPSHPELFGRLGRYEVEGVIGSGGMGVVLKGHDTELNRPIAIKLLANHLAHNGAARQRFAREARAAAAIVHDHVVAIHDIQSDAETPFMVMQYVSGESLQTRVDEQGPLGIHEILRIGMQAAAGLAAAHAQGVVHRDVKPANIMLEHGVERTLLTDFGLARVADDATVTRTGILAGTPNYMSPEQAVGEAVDHRSDLFSLGAVLYFVATGRPPFRAERAMAVLHRICHEPHRPVWQVNPDVPDELSEMIDRLLAKKPHRRFDSAEQVQRALSGLLSKLQETGRLRRRPSYRRWLRQRRRPLLLCGTLASLTLFAAFMNWPLLATTSSLQTQSVRSPTPLPLRYAAPIQVAEIFPRSEFLTAMAEIKQALGQLELATRSYNQLPSPNLPDDWYLQLHAARGNLSAAETLMQIPNPEGDQR